MIMDKQRGMVGAFKLLLILLLLLLMNQFLSSSESFNPSFMQEPIRLSANWPRRMLSGGSSQPNKPHHHKHHHTNGSSSSSDSASNYPVNEPAGPLGDTPHATVIGNTQAAECTSPSPHCSNNGTTIDPRYGVEKRLVPTGPNPLHN